MVREKERKNFRICLSPSLVVVLKTHDEIPLTNIHVCINLIPSTLVLHHKNKKFYIEGNVTEIDSSYNFVQRWQRPIYKKYPLNLCFIKVIMQGKLFHRCTHLLYCSVLSLGGNVNTRRMSKPDMGSIFHIKKNQ